MKKITIILSALIFIGFASCNKEDDVDVEAQLTEDIAKIEAYLESNNIEAEKTSSGLYYAISYSGAGANPNIYSTVTVAYTGKLLDGTVFDEGTSTFPLTNVIEGWQQGIPLFRLGGRGKLFIPSQLGYGPSGSNSIPANSVLIFDIHLISFN